MYLYHKVYTHRYYIFAMTDHVSSFRCLYISSHTYLFLKDVTDKYKYIVIDICKNKTLFIEIFTNLMKYKIRKANTANLIFKTDKLQENG